jgi:hypothetical protein
MIVSERWGVTPARRYSQDGIPRQPAAVGAITSPARGPGAGLTEAPDQGAVAGEGLLAGDPLLDDRRDEGVEHQPRAAQPPSRIGASSGGHLLVMGDEARPIVPRADQVRQSVE